MRAYGIDNAKGAQSDLTYFSQNIEMIQRNELTRCSA